MGNPSSIWMVLERCFPNLRCLSDAQNQAAIGSTWGNSHSGHSGRRPSETANPSSGTWPSWPPDIETLLATVRRRTLPVIQKCVSADHVRFLIHLKRKACCAEFRALFDPNSSPYPPNQEQQTKAPNLWLIDVIQSSPSLKAESSVERPSYRLACKSSQRHCPCRRFVSVTPIPRPIALAVQ